MVTVSEPYIALKHSIKFYASYRIANVHVYSTIIYYNISKIPACILCMEYMQLINRLRHAYGIQDKKL